MAQDWQPIETAPYNEYVLVYIPEWDEFSVERFDSLRGEWTHEAFNRGRKEESQPSHWAKLVRPT